MVGVIQSVDDVLIRQVPGSASIEVMQVCLLISRLFVPHRITSSRVSLFPLKCMHFLQVILMHVFPACITSSHIEQEYTPPEVLQRADWSAQADMYAHVLVCVCVRER